VSRSRPGEDGAVAILTAVLAVLLLTVAALAVDLGNAWARKQDAQSQVDLATLSAAQLLPRTASNQDAILDEVVRYLSSTNNLVPGQATVTRAGLTDGDDANGEVHFDSDVHLRVVAPAAEVKFGLAAVAGLDKVDVVADATAELQSQLPPMQEVLPFALPSGCPYGPGMADTPSNGPAVDDGTTFTPNSGQTGSHTLTGFTSTPSPAVQSSTTTSVSFTVGNLPNNSDSGVLRLYLGGSTHEDYPLSWTQTTAAGQSRPVTKVLGDVRVTGTLGTWRAWVLTGPGSKHSTTSADLVVGAASPAPSVGCSTSVSGNFGQLDSPGWGVIGKNQRFAHNIARGLDHVVTPFPTATADVCATNAGHDLIADAQLDETSVPDNNCLNIDTGNDGAWIMNGFVTGIGGHQGRIDAVFGHTRSGCGSDIAINGTTVNNDRLGCFLRNGATLAQLTDPDPADVSEAMIDPEITKSPRFVWIPVLRSDERINDKWQPIKMFVPGMITGETLDASTNPADPDHDGLVWSGNKITSIQVFTFNPHVLPADERSPSTAYDPTLQSIVRLID
jgi:hypothetical protein